MFLVFRDIVRVIWRVWKSYEVIQAHQLARAVEPKSLVKAHVISGIVKDVPHSE